MYKMYINYTQTLQKDGYRIKLLPAVGVFLLSKTHSLVHGSTVMAQLSIPELVFPIFFYNPYNYVPQRMFFFILVSTLFVYLHQQILCSYVYVHIHVSLQTIAALALSTCSEVKKAWNC